MKEPDKELYKRIIRKQ